MLVEGLYWVDSLGWKSRTSQAVVMNQGETQYILTIEYAETTNE